MEQEEAMGPAVRLVDDSVDEDDELIPAGPPQLTILTLLILSLMGLLLMIVGAQSIETERRFFRNLTLSTNQEIADLLSQQFVQAFSAATGLIEDLSSYPTVRRSVVPGNPDGDLGPLLEIVTRRNPVLRAISVRDQPGALQARSVAVNAIDIREFPDDLRQRLLTGEVPALLSEQYLGGGGKLCMGFAAAVLAPRGSTPTGSVEAELSLDFLQRLVDSVQIGATGKVLVVDPDRNVIFASTGLGTQQVQDFNSSFPADEALVRGSLGVAYGPPGEPERYLASVRTVRSVSRKGLDASMVLPHAATLPLPSFTSTVTPREVPDWMIVVQQDFDEGIALASRMKTNILVLVGIGLIGLMVIAKLWWDSFGP